VAVLGAPENDFAVYNELLQFLQPLEQLCRQPLQPGRR